MNDDVILQRIDWLVGGPFLHIFTENPELTPVTVPR